MIHASSRCAAVGIRSAAKTAVSSLRLDDDDLMMPGVTAGPHDPDARHDGRVPGHEIEDTGIGQRHEILLQIARAIPLMRMRGIVPLRGADDVACAGKGRREAAGAVSRREAAGMIEMQVRGQDDVDGFAASDRHPQASGRVFLARSIA